ncbi:hypothetical protein B0J13DRAFT_573495 [Dactylonectria estremocensis]|uniref:Uncharacterized protein n=1 Tax=Dactylonectria estremocensis TaxID=1079267 RepID=A0A9P9D931_9HYPO|nr:hypothetical protein B0J13DRAFT_573495 [Dactylonectria estremocensis]
MVIVIHIFRSDYTHKHLPPATDLPLKLIYLTIFILGLTLYVIYWLRRSHRHARRDALATGYGSMSSGDSSESVTLDQVAPARIYKQWRAETNDAANIASGFDTWWAREFNTSWPYFLTTSQCNLFRANARRGCNPSFTMRPLLSFKLL